MTKISKLKVCYNKVKVLFPKALLTVFHFISIAKTFLGTFSVKKQPHDPVIFKSTTVHEIQREIILLVRDGHRVASFLIKYPQGLCVLYLTHTVFLSPPQLNASLSVLRGYSRSLLSKK